MAGHVGNPGCCCGCGCCSTAPTSIAITWGSGNWGSTHFNTSFPGNCGAGSVTCSTQCAGIGTPTVILDYTDDFCPDTNYLTCVTFSTYMIKRCFEDECAQVSGEPTCVTQCCFTPGSFVVTRSCFDFTCGSNQSFSFTIHVVASFLKMSGEDSCRLVVGFYWCRSAADGPEDGTDAGYIWYRSGQLSGNCCDPITLDLWIEANNIDGGCSTGFGFCTTPPSTITVMPLCPGGLDEDCLYQGDGAGGWTLVSQGACEAACAPPGGASTGTDDFENGTCGDGEGGGV